MPKSLEELHEPSPLWWVSVFGHERLPRGKPYWSDMSTREPRGIATVQLTLGGEVVVDDESGRHVSDAGTVMLFANGDQIRYGRLRSNPRPYVCKWVNIGGSGLMDHIDVLRHRHGPVVRFPNPRRVEEELDQLMSRVDPTSPHYAGTPTSTALAVHSFVISLLDMSQQTLQHAARPVDWAVDQIMRQPTRPWSLKQYAQFFGVSREHLSRVFRQKTGLAAHAWLTRARVTAALQLLRETNLAIEQVARQSGFPNTNSLDRWIRSATHLTPTEIRAAGASRKLNEVSNVA